MSQDLEEDARRICHQLLCGDTDLKALPELTSDPLLAEEVQRRMNAVGMTVQQARGWGKWVVTGDPSLRGAAGGHDLSEPQLAALAFLLFQLQVGPEPSAGDEPRMLVRAFSDRFGKKRGWKVDYIRRAILGPLQATEYIKVVTPGGRRLDAYIAPGPRMALLDRGKLVQRLGRFLDAQALHQEPVA